MTADDTTTGPVTGPVGLTPPEGLTAVTPTDRDYARLRSTYLAVHSPAVVLLPASTEEVAEAIRWAGPTGLPLSVRSGGHGLTGSGSNDGGIVIDLSRLSDVEVLDPDVGLVRVGAGARWAQVAAALSPHGLAISSGDHGGVGVGGLATAAGIGWLVRDYGLTIDHVRAATVVLADGSIVRTDADTEPDLFWAVRGAGGYVGIVTELEIEAMRLPGVTVGQLVFEVDRGGAVVRRWADFMAKAPRELSMNGVLALQRGRPVLVLTAVVASDDPVVAERALQGIEAVGRGYRGPLEVMRYADLVPLHHLHANVGQQQATTTSALLRRVTPAAAKALVDVVGHRSGPFMQLRAMGGATGDLDPQATAWAHRDAQLLVTVSTFPPYDGRELDEATRPLWRHAAGSYRNFESRADERAFHRSFPGATGARVRALAERYDPDGVLRRVARV